MYAIELKWRSNKRFTLNCGCKANKRPLVNSTKHTHTRRDKDVERNLFNELLIPLRVPTTPNVLQYPSPSIRE